MRLCPDGKPLSIVLEIANTRTGPIDAAPMLQKYWKAVGIDMTPKVEDRALMYTRKDANEFDAMVWGGDGGLDVGARAALVLPLQRTSRSSASCGSTGTTRTRAARSRRRP